MILVLFPQVEFKAQHPGCQPDTPGEECEETCYYCEAIEAWRKLVPLREKCKSRRWGAYYTRTLNIYGVRIIQGPLIWGAYYTRTLNIWRAYYTRTHRESTRLAGVLVAL